MLERTGTVLRRETKRIEVRLDPVVTCAGCAGTGGCGIGPLVNALRRGPDTCVLALSDSELYPPGARVRVCLPAPRMLRAAVVAYGLPLATIFGGAWLASGLAATGTDLWATAGAFGGLVLGVMVGRRLVRDGDGPRLLPADPPVAAAS